MRVLLFDKTRQQYFLAPESWTADAASATDLEGTVQAVNTALRSGISVFEIVLAFDQPLLANMHLPLSVDRNTVPQSRLAAG